MIWLLPSALVSYHAQSTILWTFPNLRKSIERTPSIGNDALFLHTAFTNYTSLSLRPGCKGLSICSTLNDSRTKLAVGDTRGNLSLFNVNSRKLIGENGSADVPPISVLRACHQKMHVTDVLWQNWKTIISVRNDGLKNLQMRCRQQQ